jgi:ATP-dependent Clp protease ATP-binding subunit ClpA
MAAHNEAVAARNAEGRPEHLVLGLLAEPEGLAAKAITAQGVLLDSVRQAATAALPPAADDVPELVPYGSDAKKVLELTFREALRLGHNYIGTEHILLALLEFENGTGVLYGLGLTKQTVEEYLVEMLSQFLNSGVQTVKEAGGESGEEGGAQS